MTLRPRELREEEVLDFLRLTRRVFAGDEGTDDAIRPRLASVDLDRSIVVEDAGRLVATTESWRYPLTIPGAGPVPAAAVSRVAVRTTHRRRGLLSAMMRHQLEDVHRREEMVAALYPSEAPIYGRFGYGLATYEATIDVERHRSAFARPVDLSAVREVSTAEGAAVGRRLAAELAPRHPGFVQRDGRWWERVAADVPGDRFGAGQLIAVVHDGGAEPDGIAMYRMRMGDWENGSVEVEGLLATTPAAYTALWRHCLDVDLVKTVHARGRMPLEPLRHLFADVRACRETVDDGLWLRLVDVRAALAARRYAAEGSLSLRVEDAMCPWNAAVWALEAGDGGARCEARPTSTPGLVLTAAALASVYLGTTAPSTLAAAGLVEEGAPGALARADALFAWPEPGWAPLHF